ncbi:hypothetical protein LSCM4_06052 [Leishmania orientalis]|uniref:Uncharacterized protein n=1 Tax=Leishmania orientalis TaxID=2249476 RepID=A0A836H403_9TRYP|nr:hypothetical protein LSCM4_06052 [Leishmania orientalis]
MSPIFVEVYALALKALDPAAWELFGALEDRILHSAACLLSQVELAALRPAVMDGLTAGSPTVASCAHSAVTSGVRGAGATGAASVAADVLQYLRETLQAGIFSTFEMRFDSPTTSAPARLVKDLSRVRQQVASAQSPSSLRCRGLVLAELNNLCQSVLVLSALWMSTKFWATLSETSTLSGLIACFLRLSLPSKEVATVGSAILGGGTLEPASRSEPGSSTVGASVVVPVEQANTDALCLASTPPSSPLASVPPEARSRAEMCSVRVGAASGCDGGATRVSGERVVNSCGDISLDPLAHLAWLDGDVPEAAESLARDVEDTEMILLRCSDYTIPI